MPAGLPVYFLRIFVIVLNKWYCSHLASQDFSFSKLGYLKVYTPTHPTPQEGVVVQVEVVRDGQTFEDYIISDRYGEREVAVIYIRD